MLEGALRLLLLKLRRLLCRLLRRLLRRRLFWVRRAPDALSVQLHIVLLGESAAPQVLIDRLQIACVQELQGACLLQHGCELFTKGSPIHIRWQRSLVDFHSCQFAAYHRLRHHLEHLPFREARRDADLNLLPARHDHMQYVALSHARRHSDTGRRCWWLHGRGYCGRHK